MLLQRGIMREVSGRFRLPISSIVGRFTVSKILNRGVKEAMNEFLKLPRIIECHTLDPSIGLEKVIDVVDLLVFSKRYPLDALKNFETRF